MENLCLQCGKGGHLARECPQRTRETAQMMALLEFDVDELDSEIPEEFHESQTESDEDEDSGGPLFSEK